MCNSWLSKQHLPHTVYVSLLYTIPNYWNVLESSAGLFDPRLQDPRFLLSRWTRTLICMRIVLQLFSLSFTLQEEVCVVVHSWRLYHKLDFILVPPHFASTSSLCCPALLPASSLTQLALHYTVDQRSSCWTQNHSRPTNTLQNTATLRLCAPSV